MEHKSIKIQFKEAAEGTFTAQIATLGVVDSDMDITIPGAFPQGKELLISAYQHGSWQGALPVGKATVKEVGDAVIAEGQFNLNSVSGREHYEAVKFTGDLQEWSYGFWPVDWEMREVDGKQVRILKSVNPVEISPVLKGAGVGTTTLAIKNEGLPLSTHYDTALAAVTDLIERCKSLADLRRKEGRNLSQANRDKVKDMRSHLKALDDELSVLLAETDIVPKSVAANVFLEFSQIQNTLMEAIQ